MLETREGQSGSSARGAGLRDCVLLAVGFAGLIAFSRLFSLGFVGQLDQGMLVSVDHHYVARTVATLSTLVVLALAGRNRWFSVGVAALAAATVASVVVALVSAMDPSGTFGLPVAIAGGAANAVLLFTWMLLLSRYRPRSIVIATLVGLALAGAAIAGAPFAGPDFDFDVAAVSAFAAGAVPLVLDPKLESLRSDGPLEGAERTRVPWLTFALMLACSLLSGALYGAAASLSWFFGWEPNFYALGLGVTLVVGGTVAVMMRSRAWVHAVWAPLFALFALALVFACLPVRDAVRASAGLAIAAVFCANFLPWMVFPAIFSTVRAPRSFLAGVVLVGANSSLSALVGGAIGSVLPPSMQNLGSLSGIVAVALAATFAAAFVIHRRSIGAVGLWGQAGQVAGMPAAASVAQAAGDDVASGDGAASADGGASADGSSADGSDAEDPGVDPVEALKRRVDALVGEYGLTPRETEVALLTVQGFSCAYIADKLVVSNSTVRFHQQNVYRKLEVHSRNELIEFVSS